MNPILPLNQYIPDVEARVWADGRVYLYGSKDIGGGTDYCSHEYHVFSSADLRNWTDHGVSFHSKDSHTDKPLYAPDCICVGGKYFLFYCGADKTEGIAVSKHPGGPFRKAYPLPPADGDGIDPAVLLDHDGSLYYFWGQIRLRGARMLPDMSNLDESTLQPSLLNETEHGFHEGASIRKRNGIYYMVYADISRGKPTCLAYATSSHPLGPYKKRGIIIDNIGCDPETWNNHGSIAKFKDQWYVFYHRASRGSRVNRRVCMEPVYFDEQGNIPEVEMTTQGADGPLNPLNHMEACRACQVAGQIRTDITDCGEHVLTGMQDGDWAAFKYFNFNAPLSHFQAEMIDPAAEGTIEVRLDQSEGPLLCLCSATTGWRAPLRKSATDTRAVYIVYRGQHETPLRLKRFRFESDDSVNLGPGKLFQHKDRTQSQH